MTRVGDRYSRVMTEWMAVPDVAEALGIELKGVRELIRDDRLVAVRRGENNALYVPAAMIVDGEDGPQVLATVYGTVTVLRDGGYTDDEVVEWLMTHREELGSSPLEALREGKKAPVRRLAQTDI